MVWRASDPTGDEAAKVKYDIVRYTRGAVLDFGCGPRKAFPHFLGVDNKKDTELFGIDMRPDLVCDCTDPAAIAASFQPESVDAVFSSHLLEHVEDYAATLAAWWSLIKVGGYLVLYLPHRDLYPRIGQPGANVDHKHDFAPEDIVRALCTPEFPAWDLVVNETRSGGAEYSFLLVFEKQAAVVGSTLRSYSYRKARPPKSCCVVRHGGYGDQLQAASLFPELKRQGYHITALTTPKGRSVIEHDPHVDEWFMVEVDQVPNAELGPFWRAIAARYDRFINLNESVEGTFLALPGRIQHTWPHELRHALLNRNYAEHAAAVAGIAFRPEGQFYPTADEKRRAQRRLTELHAKIDGSGTALERRDPLFFILWSLSGSSPHKFTPHQDVVIGNVVTNLKRAVVLLVGDEACKILEVGLEHERIIPLSGELAIRDTLTLAQQCDLVLGPETGVMNAVAYEPMHKVVLLSHSSAENLTKHWHNTTAIEGVAPCWPCHQLHYTSEFCPRSEATHHAALCQWNVDPRAIYAPIAIEYAGWARVHLLRQSLEAA